MSLFLLSICSRWFQCSQDNTPFAHRIKNAGRRTAAASVVANTMASLRRCVCACVWFGLRRFVCTKMYGILISCLFFEFAFRFIFYVAHFVDSDMWKIDVTSMPLVFRHTLPSPQLSKHNTLGLRPSLPTLPCLHHAQIVTSLLRAPRAGCTAECYNVCSFFAGDGKFGKCTTNQKFSDVRSMLTQGPAFNADAATAMMMEAKVHCILLEFQIFHSVSRSPRNKNSNDKVPDENRNMET